MQKRSNNLQVMITDEMLRKLQYRAARDGLNVPEVVRGILASNLRNTVVPEHDER